MLFQNDTPVETYRIRDRIVYVKRDDLYGVYPAPKLAKLRGLRIILENLYKSGFRLVGCWDTRVSKMGQGVAAICNNFPGMHAIISYPKLKGMQIPTPIAIAKNLGAEIYPIRGNHVSICYAQVKKYVIQRGGIMLPFGLECKEAVEAVAKEAKKVPPELLKGGTLVLCCGSGVTLAGLLSGLLLLPNKIIGISSGRSEIKIITCLKRFVKELPKEVIIKPASLPYYSIPDFKSPFPTHPNYDLKAWQHLADNIDRYTDPILFWNIGS